MDINRIRNNVAHKIANFVLNTLATEDYNERMEFTYVLGLQELDRRKEANKTRAMLGSTNYEETR